MARRRISTMAEFVKALRAVPFASARLDGTYAYAISAFEGGKELADYGLWNALLSLVHRAADAGDWTAVRSLLTLYDDVERAGRRGEMYEAKYVAFLEDVRLPDEPALLREFLRNSPPAFAAALKADRGLR